VVLIVAPFLSFIIRVDPFPLAAPQRRKITWPTRVKRKSTHQEPLLLFHTRSSCNRFSLVPILVVLLYDFSETRFIALRLESPVRWC
jgi:hypothetical protein